MAPWQVHNLTIRAKGKVLLESTMLTVAAGRRYGLVGPNGKGKSTLLRMVARRQVPVPEGLDVLLVEQVGSAGYGFLFLNEPFLCILNMCLFFLLDCGPWLFRGSLCMCLLWPSQLCLLCIR